MDWTNERISEFLTLYEDEPTLWDTKSANHKNRNDHHEAWCRIQNKLKVPTPIKEIKKKRDNLMSTYRKLRRKVEASIKTSSSIDEIFKPDWPFYTVMSTFLDDVYNPKKPITFEVSGGREEVEEADLENDNEEYDEEKQDYEEVEKKFTMSNDYTKQLTMCEAEKSVDAAYSYVKKKTNKTERDECSLYSELLCKKLRKLQENTRDVAMLEIDKLIFNLKQNEMKNQASHHSQTQIPFVSLDQPQVLNNQDFRQFQLFQEFCRSGAHIPLPPQLSPDTQSCKYLKQSPNFYASPQPSPTPSVHLSPSTHSPLSPQLSPQ